MLAGVARSQLLTKEVKEQAEVSCTPLSCHHVSHKKLGRALALGTHFCTSSFRVFLLVGIYSDSCADWHCDVALRWSQGCKANTLIAAFKTEPQKDKLLFVMLGLPNP